MRPTHALILSLALPVTLSLGLARPARADKPSAPAAKPSAAPAGKADPKATGRPDKADAKADAKAGAKADGKADAKIDAKAALERLKTLAGDWEGTIADGKGTVAQVVYRVVSGGSTVMETLFPGSPHEMITMYFLDGEELRAKHFCGVGNQPEFKLDRARSTGDDYYFVFTGGTNFDPGKDGHIHSGRIGFRGERLDSGWDFYQGGEKKGTEQFSLGRKAKAAK